MNDFILGPQVSTGDYFDVTLLAQARKYGELFPAVITPELEDFAVNANYYDSGRTEYVAHKRSGDPLFLGYARKITDSWWAGPYFKNGVERNPDNNTSPKFAGMVGLILRALDGRPDMWDGLHYWSRYYLDLWCMWRMDGTYTDFHLREGSFALHAAILLAKFLPDSFPLTAGGVATNGTQLRAQLLADVENLTINYFGKLQWPDGSWRWDDWYENGDDGSLLKGIMQSFMVGMLTRPYCDLYDITTNPAVKSSIKTQICNACRHLYADGPYTRGIATRFNVPVRGFHYFYHGGTELNPTRYEQGDFPFDTVEAWHVSSARQLMGTCIGSYAFAYKISGDEFFKTAGSEMYDSAYSGRDGFRAMMNDPDKAKLLNQHVFGTSCYKGWLGGVIVKPEPEPLPPPPPPLEESPDGTKGPRIVDSERAVWTIGPQSQTLRNGTQASGGAGTEYKYLGRVVFVRGDVDRPDPERNWYKWLGSSWTSAGPNEPGVVVQPPPPPPPPPTCSISANPPTLTIPRNGSGTVVVTLTNLTGPTPVTISGVDGQLTVSPATWEATPASPSKTFTLRAKNKRLMREVKFQTVGCGVAGVKVNIA